MSQVWNTLQIHTSGKGVFWLFLQFRGVTVDGRPAGAGGGGLPSYNPPSSAKATVSNKEIRY